jgi:hypothetical protein
MTVMEKVTVFLPMATMVYAQQIYADLENEYFWQLNEAYV